MSDFLSVKAAEWMFWKIARASHEVSVVFCCQLKNMLLKCFYGQLCDLKTTVSYNTLLFFEMAQFFIASKENYNTHTVNSHFHAPRCCENNLFYPKDYLILYSLPVFLFSTVQLAVKRWDKREEKYAEKKANGFFENKQTFTPSKPLLPPKT